MIGLIERCNSKRKCNSLTDHEWIETGLLRILSQEPSGRAFLQKLSDSGRPELKRSLFFETLKSQRRLKLYREVCTSLYENIRIDNRQDDPFAQFAELERLDIETLRQSAPKGRKVIYVWDRAGIDFFQWFKWKHLGGIYFIRRETPDLSCTAQESHTEISEVYPMRNHLYMNASWREALGPLKRIYAVF